MHYDSHHCLAISPSILLAVDELLDEIENNAEKMNGISLFMESTCKDCWLKNYSGYLNNSAIDKDQLLTNKIVSFKKGEHLIKSDDSITSLYCIKEGTVKIYNKRINSKEFVLWLANRGEIVGLNSFINNEAFSFSAVAVNNVTACQFSISQMNMFLNRNPSVTESLMQNICSRIDFMESRIASFSNKSKREQLTDFLLLMTKQNNNEKDEFASLNYSVADIGNLIGISRSYLNKILFEFQRMGIIKISNKRVLVTDTVALASINSKVKNEQ